MTSTPAPTPVPARLPDFAIGSDGTVYPPRPSVLTFECGAVVVRAVQ